MDDDIVDAVIVEPQFKQVELNAEEADLMGMAMMNLINSALALETDSDIAQIDLVVNWAKILLANVEAQTVKAGLGMLP